MVEKKVLVISATVIVLLVGSFFVGVLTFPSRGVVTREVQSTGSAPDMIGSVKGTEPQSSLQVQERMVTYNAHISLETADIQAALSRIGTLAVSFGGYVAGSSRTPNGAEITIRVPKDSFHSAVQQTDKISFC